MRCTSLYQRGPISRRSFRGWNAFDDPDDIEAVLDTHDLALCLPRLVLWAGDLGHIVRNRGRVLDTTAICDVRFLGDAHR